MSNRSFGKGKARTGGSWFAGGFTLLELILSMTILSLVTLIIGSGFRLGLQAWEKGETETLETQKLRALTGVFSQALKSAYPFELKIEEKKTLVFEGKADSLLFVTASVDRHEGGFKWVNYVYGDKSLTVTEGIMPDKDFLDKVTRDPEVVDDDLDEVKFEYLEMEGENWKETWELGSGLPAAVRVKIHNFQPFVVTIPMSESSRNEDEQ